MQDSCQQERHFDHESSCREQHAAEERDLNEEALMRMSKGQLLTHIDEVSFAVYEALLFLDTHPENQEALSFFRENNRKRNAALRVYERSFGPLTIRHAGDSRSRSWQWVEQPWPWEGGNC